MPMIPTRYLARALSEGITGWLAFEFSTQRGVLFSEHYLTPSIGQILQAHARGETIGTEVTHPLLNRPAKGRPYQLDYTIGADPLNPRVAIEAKCATWGPSATRLIVTDLLRLALLAHHLGTDCLFVLAARASHIETLRDRLTFMPFEFGAHAVVKSVNADTLRTASATAFEDISALARQPIPDRFLLNGPYGTIYLDRRLSFHALTWRIRKA